MVKRGERMKVYQQSMVATKSREEVILPQEIIGEVSIRKEEEVNLRSMLHTLRDEVLSIHKDKRKWTTALLVSTIWIAIFILDYSNTQSLQLDIVRYISGGSIGENIFQIAGYMTSRAVYSYFMVSTVIPILLGEYKFEGWRQGLERIKSIDYKKESNIVMILLGISLSMSIYNFLVGRAFLENTMVSIIMATMFFKSYISGRGIVRGMVIKLLLRAKRSQNASNILSDRFVVGLISGCMLSIAFSGLNIAYTGYFVGGLVILGVLIYMGLEHKGW